MSKYVIGVDGGSTKTDIQLFDTNGKLISRVKGGSTNHEMYDGGLSELFPVLDGYIDELLSKAGAGLTPYDVSAGVFGMSGIDITAQKDAMEEHLMGLGFKNIKVFNDSFLGIKAACTKGYGISLVNGSGNTVGGIDKEGRWQQVGGYGLAFGDEGGGWQIARHVIRIVYDELYRLGPKTALTGRFLSLLGAVSGDEFVDRIYENLYTGNVQVKDVLQMLFDCGNKGDTEAIALLQRLGREFAYSVGGCVSKLSFPDDELDVVLIGSVSLNATCPIMLDTLKSECERIINKKVNLIPLKYPPVLGAVIWAIELAEGEERAAGVRDAVLKNID